MQYKLKVWISALRLRTLPLASASIILGSLLAAAEGKLDIVIAVLCLVTAILLQILSNLANDYGDAIHGADNEQRRGPRRATQSGDIPADKMKQAIWLFAVLSFAAGCLLIRNDSLLFLLLGILAIVAAITYTAGPRPYGYVGLGDLFVFVFFGLVGVLGSYFLQAHSFNPVLLLPAASCGFLSVAVLNINNIRDIESDRSAGKITIPVRLGRERAIIYHWSLLGAGFFCALFYVLASYQSPRQWLFLLALPLLLINGRGVSRRARQGELDPSLRQMAIFALLFNIVFGLGQVL